LRTRHADEIARTSLNPTSCSSDDDDVGHNRDQWNAEAVVVALYPWEVEIVERGLTCLAELAEAARSRWTPTTGPAEPARAVAEKLDLVLQLQGYGGIEGLRAFLAERDAHRDSADDLLV
jgi:hypothetical protein